MGWLGVLGSTKGLLCVTLPQPSVQEAHQLLGDKVSHAVWAPHYFEGLIERLQTYFGGQKVAFPDRLDLSGATLFQRRVWEATRLIPYGETRSYCWVAGQLGRPEAARVVGQALGKNPVTIIVPCHRVLTSSGNLGGFRGGLEMKRHLLSLEASSQAG